MRKNIRKKLVLKRETLKTLRESELKQVAGGVVHQGALDKISVNVCPLSDQCQGPGIPQER